MNTNIESSEKDFSWEQCKLGELYTENEERNSDLLGYDKTISVATMTYKADGNGAATESLFTYKVLRLGDVAFEGHTNKDFRYGRFVMNDVGTGLMSPRFTCLRPLKKQIVSFWKYYINYEPLMRPILVGATKAGTMMNELVVPDLMKQSIPVPDDAEQQKIGSFFRALDDLITLHQRKHLSFHDPRKKYSFRGKTIAWEQRKLGTFISEVTRRDAESQAPVMMIAAASGFIEQSEKYSSDNAGQSLAKYTVLHRGELAYNHGASKFRKYGSCVNLRLIHII